MKVVCAEWPIMTMHEHDNVLLYVDLYMLRWAPLIQDMKNPMHVPPLGPFDRMSIKWSQSSHFLGDYEARDAMDYIVYIM